MTTLESTGVDEVSLTDEHTTETFETTGAEPDLGSEIDQLLATLADKSTPEIAPSAKAGPESEIGVPLDEHTIVASDIHTGPANEGELFKIVSRAPKPGSAEYMVEKAEINRAAQEIEEDFDKNVVKKSMQERGADILKANCDARTAQSKKFMSPRLADRPVADAQVDEVAEIFDGMRAQPKETPVVTEKEAVHHVLPDFKPADQEIKKDSADTSHKENNDMEEFLSSMNSLKPEARVEGAPVTAAPVEGSIDKPAIEKTVPDADTHETKPIVNVLATVESKQDAGNTNPVENPVKNAQPEIIRVEAKRVEEEDEVKSAEQTPEQKRIAALEKTNQELREQLRVVLEQQKANDERNAQRFEEFMKALKERQKHEADLAEESKKTIEKLSKEVAEKNNADKKDNKDVAGADPIKRKINENGPTLLTEADLIPDAVPEKLPAKDSADMYRMFRFPENEKERNIKKIAGLDTFEIGTGADKYFENLAKLVDETINKRNHLKKVLRDEKHSIPKRIATLGLSGTYRRSAHNKGANKIKSDIKALDIKIKNMLKELKIVQKDAKKSPLRSRIDVRKIEIRRLRAIAK